MAVRATSEYDAFRSRAERAVAVVTAALGGENYRSAIRFVFSVLAVFLTGSRDTDKADVACQTLRDAADGGDWRAAAKALAALVRSTGVDLFKTDSANVPEDSARAALRALLALDEPMLFSPMSFDSVPAGWLSGLYEHLLDLHPANYPEPPGVVLLSDGRSRKASGSFFTPPYLVDFIISRSLGSVDEPANARVLDPSMGAGDFLLKALRFLSGEGRSWVMGHGSWEYPSPQPSPAEGRGSQSAPHPAGGEGVPSLIAHSSSLIAESCLFGCDIDPIAVDIARFLVWLETDGQADARKIAGHLITADALAGDHTFRWQDAFPDVFTLIPSGPGFDAVVGNPPYVAAKNRSIEGYQAAHGVRGQSDYYLLFLKSVLKNRLVKPGGSLAMVLPDPFLVRNNAATVRRTLLKEWTFETIVHISGAFPAAQVANVVLVCRNSPSDGAEFSVLRLNKTALRRQFEMLPETIAPKLARKVNPAFALAQPKAEVLYLIDGDWQRIFERIHGPDASLSGIVPPYAFLKDLNIEVIFRGEEIGKRKILASSGELPILLGGQSVQPYRIIWEGHTIDRDSVMKPLQWYAQPKILLQKSSARLIAAYDDRGFIVPQSVYGIRLTSDGYHPLYLLALLNSKFMNEYIFRAFTGYKLVQPQIELEDVRALPIRMMPFTLTHDERLKLVEQGLAAYESESLGLVSLVASWLDSGLDDGVHDLLVHLAGMMIEVDDENQLSLATPDSPRRAIDLIVDQLYGFGRRTDGARGSSL